MNQEESQLARGESAGCLQAGPRIWTWDYLEQIQLEVWAGLELGASDHKSGALTTRPRYLHNVSAFLSTLALLC